MSQNPVLTKGVVVEGLRRESVNVITHYDGQIMIELRGGQQSLVDSDHHIGFVSLGVDDARLVAMALTRAANQVERKGGA